MLLLRWASVVDGEPTLMLHLDQRLVFSGYLVGVELNIAHPNGLRNKVMWTYTEWILQAIKIVEAYG